MSSWKFHLWKHFQTKNDKCAHILSADEYKIWHREAYLHIYIFLFRFSTRWRLVQDEVRPCAEWTCCWYDSILQDLHSHHCRCFNEFEFPRWVEGPICSDEQYQILFNRSLRRPLLEASWWHRPLHARRFSSSDYSCLRPASRRTEFILILQNFVKIGTIHLSKLNLWFSSKSSRNCRRPQINAPKSVYLEESI